MKVTCRDCANYLSDTENTGAKLTGECVIFKGNDKRVDGNKNRKCVCFISRIVIK